MPLSSVSIRIAFVVAALFAWSAGSVSKAQSIEVAVLGLRAPDGDDAVARDMTRALRDYASKISNWKLQEGEVSLEQLILLNGCIEPDLSCLSVIASGLNADTIISGVIHRSSGANAKPDFQAQIFFYNARTGRIEKRVRAKIPRSKSTAEDLDPRARRYITRFAGVEPQGPIEDKTPEAAPSGSMQVKVLGASTHKDAKSIPPLWPAITTYVVSGAFFGLTAWSWATIRDVENDPAFQAARIAAGPGVSDICSASGAFRTPEVDSLCSKADTHETLQWVFLSAGIASAGVATWLTVRHRKGKRAAERATLSFTPELAPGRAKFGARLDF